MEKRKQFTFYRSYCRSIEQLKPRDQLAVFRAIMYYALDGTEPPEMNAAQKSVFYLIQPVLDTGRKRAEAGSVGGSRPKANHKQTLSEAENEIEIDKEIEDECLGGTDAFESFWSEFPVKVGKARAQEVWSATVTQSQAVMEGLTRWKASREWTREDGRFIPRAWRWLAQKQYMEQPEPEPKPCGALGGLGQAELDAIRQVLES